MPQDSTPLAPTTTPTTSADVSNAKNRNLSLSEIAKALGSGNTSVLTALASIASAITASIIGGSTGSADNALLRAKGTGGRALDASVVIVDDSGNVSGVATVTLNAGGALRTATSAGNTALLQAYDVNGAAYTTFGTLTANNDPTFDLAAGVTKGGVGIATLNTNTFVQQQGFTQVSLTDADPITWNLQTQQSAYVLLTSGVGATRALDNPTNMVAGFTYILVVQQSSSGGNALTYDTAYLWPGGTAPTLSTGANEIDVLTFVSDGSNMYGAIQSNFS